MNKKITYLIIFLFLIILYTSFSMPPHSRLFEKIERGLIQVPERSAYYGQPVDREFVGSFKAVVLLTEFPDRSSLVDKSFFDDLLNSEGLNFKQKYPVSTNVSSVREYYQFESSNNFHLEFDVYGWFEMPNDYDYYVGNSSGTGSYPNNSQKLVEDAINAADSAVDFSLYDNDNNGTVDFLLVVHTGTGAEFDGTTGEIWSHMWSISPQQRDGVTLRKYSMQPEYWVQAYDMSIGVYCHELGHLVFGLPDLYDVNGGSYGIGYWGLMGGGSWNDEKSVFGSDEISGYGGAPAEFTAWSKLKIGWYEPNDISQEYNGTVEIEPRQIYRFINDNDSRQYFLYEFKEINIYNQWLPGNEGLLIYRCDDSKYSNTQPWMPDKDLDYHYKVAIIQKDNQWSIEKKENRGDSTDLYYSGDVFNRFSNPANMFYDNSDSLDFNRIFIDNEKAFIEINETGFGVFLQQIYGTNLIRCFVKGEDSQLPSIKDDKGFSIEISSMPQHDDIFYFDVESSASPTIFISDIPMIMFR